MRLATLLAALALAPAIGCSSMPVFPRERDGASLNLATEAHVEDMKAGILQDELPRRLDSLLAEDRRRIAELQERASSQGERLDALEEEVSELSETVATLAEDVQKQAETFGAVAAQLRQTSTRLDTAIAALPTETLREFSKAIQLYLEEREAAAPQPPQPREESEEESAAEADAESEPRAEAPAAD